MITSLFAKHKPETDTVIPLTGETFQQQSAGREMAYALRRQPEITLVELGQMSGFTLPSSTPRADLLFDTLNLQNTQDDRMKALQDSMLVALSQSILGLQDRAPGIFVANGSAANAAAVKVAYKLRQDKIYPNESMTILSSTLSHRSAQQAAFRFEHNCMSVDRSSFKMNPDLVLERLKDDVLLLHLTAGSTDLGIVDELPEAILKRAKELGIWVHVDACYGAFNIGLLPVIQGVSTQKAAFQNLINSPYIDSIAVDTHKFIGPYNGACLLFPGRNTIPFADQVSYFKNVSALGGTTLGARPIAMALDSMKRLGLMGMRLLALEKLSEAIALAQYFSDVQIDPIVSPTSGMVAVTMASQAEAVGVQNLLKRYRFNCAQVNLEGPDYKVAGLRFVLPARLYFHTEPLKAIADLTRQCRDIYRGERAALDIRPFEDIIYGILSPGAFSTPRFSIKDEVKLLELYK